MFRRLAAGLSLLLAGCGGTAFPTSTVDSTSAAPGPATGASAATSSAPAAASPSPAPTSIPSVDTGGAISLELVVDGIAQPTAMSQAADGRIFVTEQGGRVRVVRDRELQPQPALDLTPRVLNDGERGLLGIVLHPDFASNGRYFVMYSNLDTDTELREFNIEDSDAAAGSLLLQIRKDTVHHHGGSLLFGPDGNLYVSVGDDGKQVNERASPNSLYGTILRLNVDVDTPGEYAIPSDNPYANGGGLPEVWDIGLRNPWRMSMDPASGDLFIGDVGQNTAEEINVHRGGIAGGLDFGWSATEGTTCRAQPCYREGITWPTAVYEHADGDCGVIGGYVMPPQGPLAGRYLYGDLCSGRIWSIDATAEAPEPRLEIESGLRFSSFGVGHDRTVYALVHYSNGSIYRIVD